jgi:hypothetical protein
MSVENCSMNHAHKGPFFTITVVAHQSGPGSRVHGKERKQIRYVVGRLCRRCVRQSLLRVKGQKLFPKRRRRSGGFPPENSLSAVDIAKNKNTPGKPWETGGKPGF